MRKQNIYSQCITLATMVQDFDFMQYQYGISIILDVSIFNSHTKISNKFIKMFLYQLWMNNNHGF